MIANLFNLFELLMTRDGTWRKYALTALETRMLEKAMAKKIILLHIHSYAKLACN
jgi:hypothetical protein